MKKVFILLSALFLLITVASVQAAAPPLNGTTWKGTGYEVDTSAYKTITITVAIKSQNGYRFRGTVTTKEGINPAETQKFAAVIGTTNQVYMVVKSTSSEETDVVIDAKYNPTAKTISGFWRGIGRAEAGYFTLNKQ